MNVKYSPVNWFVAQVSTGCNAFYSNTHSVWCLGLPAMLLFLATHFRICPRHLELKPLFPYKTHISANMNLLKWIMYNLENDIIYSGIVSLSTRLNISSYFNDWTCPVLQLPFNATTYLIVAHYQSIFAVQIPNCCLVELKCIFVFILCTH